MITTQTNIQTNKKTNKQTNKQNKQIAETDYTTRKRVYVYFQFKAIKKV